MVVLFFVEKNSPSLCDDRFKNDFYINGRVFSPIVLYLSKLPNEGSVPLVLNVKAILTSVFSNE